MAKATKAEPEPVHEHAFISTVWNESQTSQESFNARDFDQAWSYAHKKNVID